MRLCSCGSSLEGIHQSWCNFLKRDTAAQLCPERHSRVRAILLAASTISLTGCVWLGKLDHATKYVPPPDPLAAIRPPGMAMSSSANSPAPTKRLAFVAPPPPLLTFILSASWPHYEYGATGLILYAGNRPGLYSISLFLPVDATNADLRALDSTLPWFVNLAAYDTNAADNLVNCVTNEDASVTCATNHFLISPFAGESMLLTSNCIPFTMITNGQFAFTGCAPAGSIIQLQASADLIIFTNLPPITNTADGPWQYLEPEAASPRFFRSQ